MNDTETESSRRGRFFRLLFFAYVIAIGFLVWGIAIGRYEVFPFAAMQQLLAFVQGDPFEDTSLLEKLENDFGGAPRRFLHPRAEISRGYSTVRVADGVFSATRAPPVFFSDTSEGGYLIYGIFEFTDGRYGALLVDHDGAIRRHWVFSRPPGNNELNPVKGGYLPGGYVVSNAFYALQVQDYCGNEVWSVPEGNFHHSVEPLDENSIWVLNDFDFERRSARDGALLEHFSIFDIIAANPDLHIFEPRLLMTDWQFSNLGTFRGSFPNHEIADPDPFHFNDATPLTPELEDSYPDFRAGDLVVSSRALNLLFVVRPETREVLWHAFGKTSRQHDPDFNNRGSLTIFDNNNHGEFSRIVEMDLSSKSVDVIVDGADIQLTNEAHGNHQLLEDGSVVLVDYRGRMIHIDARGQLRFDFHNLYNDDESMDVRNVHYLTDEQLSTLESACP